MVALLPNLGLVSMHVSLYACGEAVSVSSVSLYACGQAVSVSSVSLYPCGEAVSVSSVSKLSHSLVSLSMW